MEDVLRFLQSINIQEAYEVFEKEDITIGDIRDLTDDDLKEIGIIKMGQRKRIMREIKSYKPNKEGAHVKTHEPENTKAGKTVIQLSNRTPQIVETTNPGANVNEIRTEQIEGENTDDTVTEDDISDKWIPPMTKSYLKGSKKDTEAVSGNMKEEAKEIVTASTISKHIEDMLRNDGAFATAKYINSQLTKWKTERVKVAVFGASTTGKSTFINKIRGMNKEEKGYAQVGYGDTTSEITEYQHPENAQIVFVDVPGLSLHFTLEKLLEKVVFQEFDFIIYFFKSAIGTEDKSLISEIKSALVPFCLLRSHFDADVFAGKSKDEKEVDVLRNVRHHITRWLKIEPSVDATFFVISSLKPEIGEWDKFINFLERKLPSSKYDAILLHLPGVTSEVIEAKYQNLKRRIWYVSCGAAVISAVPIPLLDIPLNLSLVKSEVERYVEVFGLDKEEVKKIEGIKTNYYGLTSFQFITSMQKIVAELGFVLLASQTDIILPGLGSIISATITKKHVARVLERILEELKKDAYTVYNYYLTESPV